jgi:hypothetical protein
LNVFFVWSFESFLKKPSFSGEAAGIEAKITEE